MYRRIRTQVGINPAEEFGLLRQLYQILSELTGIFGKDISIEWGVRHGDILVFQIRGIQAFRKTKARRRNITFFKENDEQGLKYQAMRYFHSCGMFPAKVLFFEKQTDLHEIERRFEELDTRKPTTVRFSSKNEIGLPRRFAWRGDDALRYIRGIMQEDWALIVYNSIQVQDSYELYLDHHQAILEHVPGMWESDSQLFTDIICINEAQMDYWLVKDDRLAKFEDAEGIIWRKTAPLNHADADALTQSLALYIERLREDFSADLPLNFHFVGDRNQFYFLNCRLTGTIMLPKDTSEDLYCVSSIDDIKDWDGHSSILFTPQLERGEEIFLTEYVSFLKKAGVPIFIKFGILSHPAIMLREFGIAVQPFLPNHTHYIGGANP